jgi:hypothetical protein
MDFVLPSITAILFALAMIIYVFPRLAPVILAFFAGAALVYGLYNHYLMFGAEYSGMTWVDKARTLAPQLMVGLVVTFLIAYLLFAFGTGNTPSIPMISKQPSPASATNPVTEAIGNSFNSVNSRRNYNNPYSRGV